MPNKIMFPSELIQWTAFLSKFASQLRGIIKTALGLILCGCLLFPLAGCNSNIFANLFGKTTTESELLYSSKGIDLTSLSNGSSVSAILDTVLQNGKITILAQFQSQEKSSSQNKETVISYNFSLVYVSANGVILGSTPLDVILDTVTDVPISISESNDGNLYLLFTHTDPKTRKVLYKIAELDDSGKPVEGTVTLLPEDVSTLRKFAVDKNDNLIFADTSGSSGNIQAFSQNGKLIYQIADQTLTGEVYRVGEKIYVGKYSQDGSRTTLIEMNNDAESPKNMVTLPEAADKLLSGASMSDGQNIWCCASDGLYKIDLESKQVSNMLFWKNCDIPFSANSIVSACRLSDTSCFVEYIGNDGNAKMCILSQRDSTQMTHKQIVIIGGLYVSRNPILVKAVYNFNANNSKYQIQIKDYSGDAASDLSGDTTNSVSAMNTEILAGDGPDIICGNESFQAYEESGVLLDLNTLIAADNTFQKDEYYSNMFSLCENEGKLFKVFPCYSIQGLTGSKAVLGDRTGWTIDEFETWAQNVPGGMTMSDSILQSSLVAYTVACDLGSFVNWDTKQVNFNNQSFYQLLEYAKKYGLTQDEYKLTNQTNSIIDDKAIINRAYINSANDYNIFVQVYRGEIAVTGYPSFNKSGPVCVPGYYVGISASTKNKDAAWEFVKYLLSESCQKEMRENSSIPVLTKLLDEQIELTEHPEKADATSGVVHEGMYIMSEKSAQDFRELISSLKSIPNYSTAIDSVIQEEIPAYFNGDKTVEEVADIIQNRVQIVVNEAS